MAKRLFSSVFCALLVSAAAVVVGQTQKVSEFGKYEGYSRERFEQWVVSSQYVSMRDGVKLAVDVVRPAVDGQAVEQPLPVVWTHSRYHRNPREVIRILAGNQRAASIKSMVDADGDLQRLVRHGYVVAAVGVRGSGASFGTYEGLFSPNETRDAYEITQWLAAQPWCDGNVGMFGASYLGITQYMCASQSPPALKAIFPNVAGFDVYDVVYPGGVYRQDLIQHWGLLTRNLDTLWLAPPVDEDTDGELLKQAIAQHQKNWDVIEQYRAAKFRDAVSPQHSYATHNPSAFLEQINEAKVPCYHWNGFLDVFVLDSTIWFANYAGPQKLGIGPWPHGAISNMPMMAERGRLTGIEQHRWFDYWLKGIDNGIMDEPAVHYATLSEPDSWIWRSAGQWPPADSRVATWYFSAGPCNSVASVNAGRLSGDQPKADDAADAYKVDFSTTTGTSSRWDNAVGQGAIQYGDMTNNDEKALTYTTDPLPRDVVVTGHPTVTLFVESTENDGDFYVLLEEVDDQGSSHYVTEGVLRASHRTLSPAPFDNLGLPYQRSNEADKQPLIAGEPNELKMDLHPISTIFNAGHRIRVTVMCADKDNTEPPPVSAGTEIKIFRDPSHASRIELPIEPADNAAD